MDGAGNVVPMARTSHPPLSGGPISIGVGAPNLPSILPSANKPMSSSSYLATGTKFQSSHAPIVASDAHQYTSSNSSSSGSVSSISHAAKGSQVCK